MLFKPTDYPRGGLRRRRLSVQKGFKDAFPPHNSLGQRLRKRCKITRRLLPRLFFHTDSRATPGRERLSMEGLSNEPRPARGETFGRPSMEHAESSPRCRGAPSSISLAGRSHAEFRTAPITRLRAKFLLGSKPVLPSQAPGRGWPFRSRLRWIKLGWRKMPSSAAAIGIDAGRGVAAATAVAAAQGLAIAVSHGVAAPTRGLRIIRHSCSRWNRRSQQHRCSHWDRRGDWDRRCQWDRCR